MTISPAVESGLVLDASVVAKWFLPEEFRDQARALLRGNQRLLAPTLLPIEIGNLMLKKIRRGEFPRDRVSRVQALIIRFVELQPSLAVHDLALDIALRHDRSFYDSVYVALALNEGCPLVTADERLYNALKAALPDTMLWVGDVYP